MKYITVIIMILSVCILNSCNLNSVGECISGNCVNGKGTMICSNQKIYAGRWVNGKPNGQGVMDYFNGDKYIGQFKDGNILKGTLIISSGDTYIGQFKDREIHGIGTLITPDSQIYIGEFKNGNMHGRFKVFFPNGDTSTITANVMITNDTVRVP